MAENKTKETLWKIVGWGALGLLAIAGIAAFFSSLGILPYLSSAAFSSSASLSD